MRATGDKRAAGVCAPCLDTQKARQGLCTLRSVHFSAAARPGIWFQLLVDNSPRKCVARKLCYGPHAQFMHEAVAVEFHRFGRNVQHDRNLLC